MEIKNIRIEERLIHGQIATVWLQHLRPSRIIIIDNDTSKNDFQKQLLKVACPQNTKLSIFSVDRAIERLAENPYENESVFVLFKDTKNLKEFFDKGFNITEVNVGNISGKSDSIPVKKAVSISRAEAEMFKDMSAKGVRFTAKMVPNDPNIDFMALIDNL